MENAKDEKQLEKMENVAPVSGAKKGFNAKVLIFGIPLFAIQLVAVYFITANILLNKIQPAQTPGAAAGGTAKNSSLVNTAKSKELGKYVYMVEDLIVNPAKTEGKRLLLTSLGFDVPTDEDLKELKTKEVLLKDAIISVMSAKVLEQLGNMSYRDTLRTEIVSHLGQVMPKLKINTIYFSKYILQ